MNKSSIKNFSIWARRELISKVNQRMRLYEIYPENGKTKDVIDVTLNGKILSQEEKKSRKALLSRIEEYGFEEIVEEVAYTWFNRFIAIRFMEVNNYLPRGIRVFSSIKNEFHPQILEEAIHLDMKGLDEKKILDLYSQGNKEEELFKYLFISQCNELNIILPGMFQKINDYTELLLPDNLLMEGSVLDRMIKDIGEEDWREQVQIIGWLYQYYNIELKEKVIGINKGTIAKKDIPAATQVFTPDWIVRYIVDNSLGKYWIERNPNSKLKEKLEYLILPKDGKINYVNEKIEPKDLKIIDNCVGSGHFLVYEFEILMEIYKEYGYREKEACESIIRNNLYGLDIDERARQLAYFSLMMKARSYSKRIFEKNLNTNIYAITESNNIDRSYLKIMGKSLSESEREYAIESLNKLLDNFKDAKNYGSILKLEKVDFELCSDFINDDNIGQLPLSYMDLNKFTDEVNNILLVASIMCDKYHVVATNPPYLNKMNPELKKYADKNYKDYKTDLFSMFMFKNFDYCKKDGYSGFMTPNVWMFIKSYKNLRKYILENKSIDSLVQIAKGSFFKESTVDIVTFVLKNSLENSKGNYIRLENFSGGMEVQREKTLEAINNSDCDYFFVTDKNEFEKIPGMPIAYWASDKVIKVFEDGKLMENILDVKQGLATADNDRFLRLWSEVDINKTKFDSKDAEDLLESGKKWIPYNKGGQRRQWYGNYDYLVNWENNGFEIKNFVDDKGKQKSVVRNPSHYFKEAITWGLITSGGFSIRYRMSGGIHDVIGMSAFNNNTKLLMYLLGLMGSKISDIFLTMLNPTMALQIGDFKNFPVLFNKSREDTILKLVDDSIEISKKDWDMNETSWDFKISPLISNKIDGKIESAYESYKREVNERFEKLKANEEELNKIFIDIYGLQDELTPEVSDRDITVAKVFDKKEDIDEVIKGNRYVMTREDVVKNFLSYFIGCLMGRYSLDEEGLAYAGGDFDYKKYNTFMPDNDGIAIFTDDEYFDEDIVNRFQDFLVKIFGSEYLDENLDFIASELKGTSLDSPKDKIRKYFLNNFYKDHLKTYQKKPIYWQYDSGKNASVRGIFYLHRYNKDTFARIRINYIFEMQNRYKQELERLNEQLNSAKKAEKIQIQKKMNELKKKINESEKYEEKVQHLADSYIEIDLDDGVDENYKLFKDVLSKIK
ncbi:MAG: BREX-1 system adenine-specific DNA-methyltransferase PglX [Peptoniphilus grossensis]